jgi:serine/threonine protein kinase
MTSTSRTSSILQEYKLENDIIKIIEEELDCISILDSKKEEFLKSVVKFIKIISNKVALSLKFLESSGSSVVILSPNYEYVCQYFVNKDVYNKINKLLNDISEYDNIKMSQYIVQPIFFCDDVKSIYWKKITTLNSLSNLKEFILKNLDKLITDISIALSIIHNSGYIHGDSSIDNIGINENGNFCLFDFDSSSKITDENNGIMTYNDFRIFYKSIEFHTGF